MLAVRAARNASATRAARTLRRCAAARPQRWVLDRGTTELRGCQRKGLLHGSGSARLLHALEQRIEFVGERVESDGLRPDQRAVLVDRDQHRAGLVMLGNGEPALPGDTVEDASEAVLGDAGRNLRRTHDFLPRGANTADYGRHGESTPGPDPFILRRSGQKSQIGQFVGEWFRPLIGVTQRSSATWNAQPVFAFTSSSVTPSCNSRSTRPSPCGS